MGLETTYWVYGVLAGFIWAAAGVALGISDGTDRETALKLVGVLKSSMLVYYGFVFVGIWNAANKYKGNPVWATLAKFVVVLVAVPTAIMALKQYFLTF